MMGLTEVQLKTLEFIRRYTRDMGSSPSFDEIAFATGLKSKSGVARVIRELEERGAIMRLRGHSRSISLMDCSYRDTPLHALVREHLGMLKRQAPAFAELAEKLI